MLIEDHRRACDGFTAVVHAAEGHWAAPSPCIGWDARAVLEHVIGFHDVLLLRPLEAKPDRPKDDAPARWSVTVDALFEVLGRSGVMNAERQALLPMLSTDVVVHTWDLGRAIGVEVNLDPQLCQRGLDRTLAHLDRIQDSRMYDRAIVVPDDGSSQDRLVAILGRDPGWSPARS
jgi:uncharacterized protein (TIGR03086 family)